jgi:peptidyl-prolyl cis-trans isomerase SurA
MQMNPLRMLVFGLIVTLLAAGVGSTSHAQSSKNASSKETDGGPWLIKWKGGEVTLPEFEDAFQRMNGKPAFGTTLDSLKDFLSVYADYRLKLEEAKEDGLDDDPSVQKEIVGYRKMLSGPFILDKEVTDPAVRALYDRRQWDVHAGHFLASVKNWNDPADTLKAYKKAMQAIKMLDEGYPFTYICVDPKFRALFYHHDISMLHGGTLDTTLMENWGGSDDTHTAPQGGDLGFFMAGMTVRQFEDALFSLKPGEYTKTPVKTRYGYHVIILYEKEPHTGGVHVKHILVSVPKVGGVDTMSYYHTADSLLTAIHNGANFEDVARQSSNDKPSAARGGDMDTINHEDRRSELPFDRAAYALKDGEISGIVRTSFGYHIIKRVNGVRGRTFEESKEHLEQFYKKYYFDEDKAAFIAKIESAQHFHLDSTALDYVMAHIDSSRTSADSNWAAKLKDRSRSIFQMGDINWTVGSLVDTLTATAGSPLARNQLRSIIAKNAENTALQIEARVIPTKYPEFEKIMEDYKNGIVLFDLENKRVWSKVVPDSASELKYYEAHKDKYIWPERVDITEIYVSKDSLAKALYKRAIAGENFDTLAKKYTERPGFKQKAGHWGLLAASENQLAKQSFDFIVGEIKEPFAFQGGYSIVRLNQRDPIHQKTFAEARQEVASQYQDERAQELRAQWVEELRTKYDRKINEPAITAAWTKQHTPSDQGNLIKN